MSNAVGRSVRLFLVDGKATGLITAEIMNWTGHVLAGPRAELPRFLARPEVGRTGIYLLYGRDPGNPDTVTLYIGESDLVGARLKQHNQEDKKAYWERTCVITSKDQNITKAHARYLEARLLGIAQAAGRALLDNGTAPPPVALPEADRSDMEFFIKQIRLVLPVLGLDFLREPPTPSIDAEAASSTLARQVSPLFELAHKKSGAQAQAQEIEGDFVVLKGARMVTEWKQTSTALQGYAKLHRQLLDNGKLTITPGQSLAVLQADVAFSSPSAASAVILGRSDNGRLSWKVKGSQMTYAAWQEQQIRALETDNPSTAPTDSRDLFEGAE
jgi:hypothetical protein